MKGKISTALLTLLFLIGFGILAYPTISNQWNTYRQSKLIGNYENTLSDMTPEDFTAQWERAKNFNSTITSNNIYADVFGADDSENMTGTEYWQVLNVSQDGIMGYLSIPKINIKLAIYHGTNDAVIQTGVGHMNGTSLPVGGEGTHSVLAAHRGLPSAKLFTDIDRMKLGDMFYIHILDETLAYKVDDIQDMVDKDDTKTLEADLAIQEGRDLVTLFTCTPYGVNSHRLLVRGTRVPYNGEEEETASIANSMVQSIQNYYMFYLALGLAVTILLIQLMRIRVKRKDVGKSAGGDS